MKTKYIILFIMIGMLGFAKEGYVNARICPVQSSNEASSAKVGILKQGQKVSILETKGEWLQIKSDTIQGFVKTRFISNEPVVIIATVADSMKDLSNIEVRKRASTYTSSAAAIRGLSSESVRDRENVSFNDYDFESIKWIENNFSFATETIEEFSLQELN